VRRDKVEQKLAAIEKLADEIRDQVKVLRTELGREEPTDVMFERISSRCSRR